MTDQILINRTVLEQALNALNLAYDGKCRLDTIPNATDALRAALEQQQVEQEQAIAALTQRRDYLRKLSYKDSAITRELEKIHKALSDLENHAEPYCHVCVVPTKDAGPTKFFTAPSDPRAIPLYTHPQPPRQPLTDEQIGEIESWFSNEFGLEAKHSIDFARAIERAHGIGGEA